MRASILTGKNLLTAKFAKEIAQRTQRRTQETCDCQPLIANCQLLIFYAFTSGLPGELNSRRCSLAVRRARSASAVAFSRRLRSCTTLSLRVRRRRISGRRLGADMNQGSLSELLKVWQIGARCFTAGCATLILH